MIYFYIKFLITNFCPSFYVILRLLEVIHKVNKNTLNMTDLDHIINIDKSYNIRLTEPQVTIDCLCTC